MQALLRDVAILDWIFKTRLRDIVWWEPTGIN
jgi:hypothetical protein